MRRSLSLPRAAVLGAALWLGDAPALPAISEPGFELGLGSFVREDDTPPDLVSKLYQPQSLRGRSAAELLQWMGPGKEFADYSREQALKQLPPAALNPTERAAVAAEVPVLSRLRGGPKSPLSERALELLQGRG